MGNLNSPVNEKLRSLPTVLFTTFPCHFCKPFFCNPFFIFYLDKPADWIRETIDAGRVTDPYFPFH
jgi:hypothetical protein